LSELNSEDVLKDQEVILQFPKLMKGNDPRQSFDTKLLAVTVQVDNLGWDTTYVITAAHANTILAKHKLWPQTFQHEAQPGYPISGDFGLWQIAPGGNGQNLKFSTKVPTATLTTLTGTVPIQNMTCTFMITLDLLPQPSLTASAKGGTPMQWKVRTKAVSSTEPVVTMPTLTFDGPAPSFANQMFIVGNMWEWFQANIAQFTHVFATVNLNERADKESFQWVKPTFTGYAYYGTSDTELGHFGVLNQVLNNSAEGVTYELGPGTIPTGAKASFNISQPMFLEKLVLPGCKYAFADGATDADFEMTAENTTISNKGEINMKPVTYGGIDYTPVIEKAGDFKVTVHGEDIQVYVLAKTTVSPGIYAYVEITSHQRMVLANKPDGSQTLIYQQIRDPDLKHWTKLSEGVIITVIVLGIIAGLCEAGGALARKIVGEYTKKIIAAIIIGIVLGIGVATIELIEKVLADAVGKDTPALDLIVSNSTDPIQWDTTASKFTLQTAGLNGVLQLGGDPGSV